jgi:hypothetical protein
VNEGERYKGNNQKEGTTEGRKEGSERTREEKKEGSW